MSLRPMASGVLHTYSLKELLLFTLIARINFLQRCPRILSMPCGKIVPMVKNLGWSIIEHGTINS